MIATRRRLPEGACAYGHWPHGCRLGMMGDIEPAMSNPSDRPQYAAYRQNAVAHAQFLDGDLATLGLDPRAAAETRRAASSMLMILLTSASASHPHLGRGGYRCG
jgi:hypothetical protein